MTRGTLIVLNKILTRLSADARLDVAEEQFVDSVRAAHAMLGPVQKMRDLFGYACPSPITID